VFPLNYDELSESGVFAVQILGDTMDDIESLERGMGALVSSGTDAVNRRLGSRK
jgi:hypothetical protein